MDVSRPIVPEVDSTCSGGSFGNEEWLYWCLVLFEAVEIFLRCSPYSVLLLTVHLGLQYVVELGFVSRLGPLSMILKLP